MVARVGETFFFSEKFFFLPRGKFTFGGFILVGRTSLRQSGGVDSGGVGGRGGACVRACVRDDVDGWLDA